MSRRLTAAAGAAALLAVALPALPAFASAASTASITSAKAIYPGGNSFTISVTNGEAPLTGRTIDAIRVFLPVSEANIGLGDTAGSASGFTASKTDLGDTEFLTYRGGRLLPGQTTAITFPVTVGSPIARDLLGDFRVQVSSDDFKTSKNATTTAGGLTAKVQVLEIINGSLKALSPAGAADGTATAGQKVNYVADVKNYSQSPLSVTTALTSPAGDRGSSSLSVPAGGTATSTIPVTLATGLPDRTAVLTGTATAPNAEAPTRSASLNVQAPATVAFSNLQPTRAKSGDGSGRNFTATATKTGAPSLTLTGSKLVFGLNTCLGTGDMAFAAGNVTRSVTFTCPNLLGTGLLGATATSGAIDNNDFADYAFTSLLGDITIDNAAPVLTGAITLPLDGDGDRQTASKNGDTISVSGTVANAGDLVASSVKATLVSDAGDMINVPVTTATSGDSRSFSGSASNVQWKTGATNFWLVLQAADTAGNIGNFDSRGASPVGLPIDNVAPDLGGPEMNEEAGTVTTPTTIEVRFVDATLVAGGCNASAWSIDGVPGSVTEVRTTNGKPCTEAGDGGRVLVLRNALEPDTTPRVTYEAPARAIVARPTKDGAGNDALRDTIDTVTKLVPRLPNIVNLERRDGAETAAFENAFFDNGEKTYYTNTTGAQALRLTVGGIRAGYQVQVFKKGSATPVASRTFDAGPSNPLATEYEGNILVPLTTDALSEFTVRLVSSKNNPGAAAPFKVAVDKTAPAVGAPALGATTADGTTVSVPLSEPIALGSDFADNWFVAETVATERGTSNRSVNANTVTATDSKNRTLTATLADPTKFAGVAYVQQTGVRYEDRAGNPLQNTPLP